MNDEKSPLGYLRDKYAYTPKLKSGGGDFHAAGGFQP